MSELEQTEFLERSRTVTPDLASVSSQVASPMESYKLPPLPLLPPVAAPVKAPFA